MAIVRPLRLRSRGGHEPGRRVTWLELCFDLVFVAAVSQVGAPLGVDYALPALGRFAMLFVLIWWAWHGHASYSTRFDRDDALQRWLTVVQMFAVAVMAVNAKDSLGSRDSAGFAAAYALMRFVLVAQYFHARRLPEARRFATVYVVGFGAAATLWLVSALTPAPARFWLWGLALLVDLVTPLAGTRHTVDAPPDAAHLPERFGLFTIILIGDAMVGVMRGMESQSSWPLDAFLAALLGMILVFLVWWWYFDASGATDHRLVSTREDAARLHIWTFAHVPLYLGIIVLGVGIHHTIAVAAMGHLHAAESWILCAAAATVMASLAWIAARGRGLPYLLAGAALALGPAGPSMPCSVLIALLTALMAAQVRVSAPDWASRVVTANPGNDVMASASN